MSEGQLAMISECMVNGSINEFVKANPDANLLKRVHFRSRSLCALFAPCSLTQLPNNCFSRGTSPEG